MTIQEFVAKVEMDARNRGDHTTLRWVSEFRSSDNDVDNVKNSNEGCGHGTQTKEAKAT
jgi:hypothetical protein